MLPAWPIVHLRAQGSFCGLFSYPADRLIARARAASESMPPRLLGVCESGSRCRGSAT
ncbi:unnamed protein product [Amoebophrya sp. A120]|nr:unnamed protein product [Amoebophrya sp. A120]|eukprot:GSA120T00024748001.1